MEITIANIYRVLTVLAMALRMLTLLTFLISISYMKKLRPREVKKLGPV